MKKYTWCYAVVFAAAMVFANLATAGVVVGDFQVDAEGEFIEDGADFIIDASVVEQDPDFGFEFFDAAFEVDEFGDPNTFIGAFTLSGGDGELFAAVTGALFHEEFFVGMAGVFEITGGSGIFDGVSGGGVFTALGVGDEAGEIVVSLVGAIIPAPAAFALFGAAGLIRRRRRA